MIGASYICVGTADVVVKRTGFGQTMGTHRPKPLNLMETDSTVSAQNGNAHSPSMHRKLPISIRIDADL
jgi:hypothetical protein